MTQPAELSFDELRSRIEIGHGPERDIWINRFIQHYLDPRNETLRRIARREFFAQLRPVYTVEDVLDRTAERLLRSLQDGSLRLESEKKFLTFATCAIRWTIQDLGRLTRLPMEERGLGDLSSGGVDPAVSGAGPSTELAAAEIAEKVRELLRTTLPPNEWYLLRRHYFESATFAQIADEVLPQATAPLTQDERDNREAKIRMRVKRIRERLFQDHPELESYLEA